jgi:hypothetical protein
MATENVTPEQAEVLVREMLAAVTEYTKAVNGSRGHKGAGKRERRAVAQVLQALLGQQPSPVMVDRICDY